MAGLINNGKHRVLVLEQDSPETFAKKWDWHDNVDIARLKKLGYGHILPDEFPPQEERMVSSPSGRFKLRFSVRKKLVYEQVYRPQMLVRLQEKAREIAGLRFDTRVQSLLVRNDQVVGVALLDGQEIRADLVVDCTGNGRLSYELIGDALAQRYSTVFRGIFPYAGGASDEDERQILDSLKLKPRGIEGIARYGVDARGNTDVVIRKMGEPAGNWESDILKELVEENSQWDKPQIQDGQCGGYICTVGPPLTQLVFDGYALLGDSACMASALFGEGLVNALHGAKILAEVINEIDSADMASLWKYQLRFFREAAKNTWRLGVLSHWLLKSSDSILEKLFSSRVFGAHDAERIFRGQFLSLAPQKILQRGVQLLLHPRLLFALIPLFASSIWAEECARSIPDKYSEKQFSAWKARMDKALRG